MLLSRFSTTIRFMIELDNETTYIVPLESLEKIASALSKKEIELLFVDDETMQAINAENRNINTTTDVLSFPYLDMPLLGSIVISVDYAQRGSDKFGHTLDHEVQLLFIHGLLHLLGFDHEVDSGEMRTKEAELIEQFQLPKSLIVRTEQGL